MACVTNRLIYDPTDANSIAASSTVGSHTLAGDGTPIGQTAGALDVNVTALSATDVDIRDLTHVSDSVRLGDGTSFFTSTSENSDIALDVHISNSNIEVTQGTDPWVIGDGGGSITVDGTVAISGDVNVTQGTDPWVVSATDLDIRDLSAATDSVESWTHDGTGNAITSTTGSLDVNVTNEIDLDDDLADTAIENTATAVSTTAVNVVASALANRKWLAVANEGNKAGYFGKTGVTVANGFPLYPSTSQVWRIGPSVAPQFIGGTGSSSEDYRVMELS